MMKHNYSIGGEQLGHIIFPEFNTTGDGLITAVQTLKVMKKWNKPLSETKLPDGDLSADLEKCQGVQQERLAG